MAPAGVPCWPDWDLTNGLSNSDLCSWWPGAKSVVMDCCCQAHSQSSRTADAGVAMLSVSMAWARASSEPAPWRHNLGGLERHVILPWPVRSRHNSARSDPLQSPANPGQAAAARAKRGKRRVLFAGGGGGYRKKIAERGVCTPCPKHPFPA